MADTAVMAPKPSELTPKQRSELGNDPYRLRGIDRRSRAGRRFAEIVETLIGEFGPGDPDKLRELAGLRFSLEERQVAVMSGKSRAADDMVRLSNIVAKREKELRQARRGPLTGRRGRALTTIFALRPRPPRELGRPAGRFDARGAERSEFARPRARGRKLGRLARALDRAHGRRR
jgi:hypothetical protein